MDPDRRIAAWAAAHHSVITRTVAREAGLNDRQIRYRVGSGRWEEIRSGLFVPAGVAVTPVIELAAAVLVVPGVASHRSAAWLHGLLDDPPPIPEVTASLGARTDHERMRLHRTADLLGRDTQTVDGIRCTNAVRTCIDMGARLDADALEALIDRARHQRLVHLNRVITRFFQLARKGRDGTQVAREALQRLDPVLEPAESDLETRFVQVLRERGVPLPVRQHPVRIAGEDFRLDVAYPQHRLVIESDGFASHGTRDAFERDRQRQNLLVLDGWRILRFTWRQICGQPDLVAQQVLAALDLLAA